MINIKQSISDITWGAKLAYKRYKFRGLFNYFLSKIDLILRLPFVLAKPTRLHIPVIEGICNLSCKICFPFQPEQKRELSFETFKKIFDKFKYTIKLNLTGEGETLMAKDLFKMIDYAKSKKCYLGLITNMTLLNEDMAEKIVKSKLDYLGISIDAATPELFEKIRCGAKFKTVINNIKILNQIKRRFGSKSPDLSFVVTAIKENIYEIPKIVELAYQLGIKSVAVHLVGISNKRLTVEDQSLTNYPELAERLFLAAHKKAKELGINFIYPNCRRHKIKFFKICMQPWTVAYIRIDGAAIFCCTYFLPLGNIFKQDIEQIWNNEFFKSMRKIVKRERSICYYCLNGLNQLGLKPSFTD